MQSLWVSLSKRHAPVRSSEFAAVRFVTPSAALKPGEAAGFRVGKAGLVRVEQDGNA